MNPGLNVAIGVIGALLAAWSIICYLRMLGARERTGEAEMVIATLSRMIGDDTCTILRRYEDRYDMRLSPMRDVGRHHRER